MPGDVAAAIALATVDQPAPGAWVLAKAGNPATIFVQTDGWAAGDRVWAQLYAIGAAPPLPANPANNPEGYVELQPNDSIRSANVPNTGGVACAYQQPASNNIGVRIVFVPLGGGPTQHLRDVEFKSICRTFSQVVPAHACPWFLFRQDDDGPLGEDIGTHRPVRVRIPSNAHAMTLTAGGWWRKQAIGPQGDSGASGPAGMGDVWPLKDDRYRTESATETTYHPIKAPDDPQPGHNLLVGILEPHDLDDWKSEATAAKILKLGASHTFAAPANSHRAIHLGMWDGLGWNKGADEFSPSNSGEATVLFTWEPAP